MGKSLRTGPRNVRSSLLETILRYSGLRGRPSRWTQRLENCLLKTVLARWESLKMHTVVWINIVLMCLVIDVTFQIDLSRKPWHRRHPMSKECAWQTHLNSVSTRHPRPQERGLLKTQFNRCNYQGLFSGFPWSDQYNIKFICINHGG